MPSSGGAKPPPLPVWAGSWDEVFGGRDIEYSAEEREERRTLAETLENRIATLLWTRTVRAQLTSWEQAEGVAADILALLAGRLDPLGLEAAADSLLPLGRAARWPYEYVQEQAGFVVRAYLGAAVDPGPLRAASPEPAGGVGGAGRREITAVEARDLRTLLDRFEGCDEVVYTPAIDMLRAALAAHVEAIEQRDQEGDDG